MKNQINYLFVLLLLWGALETQAQIQSFYCGRDSIRVVEAICTEPAPIFKWRIFKGVSDIDTIKLSFYYARYDSNSFFQSCPLKSFSRLNSSTIQILASGICWRVDDNFQVNANQLNLARDSSYYFRGDVKLIVKEYAGGIIKDSVIFHLYGSNSGSAELSVVGLQGTRLQAIPNPFTSSVHLMLPGEGEEHSVINVYALSGSRVGRLCGLKKENNVEFNWNGRDNLGRALAAGVYLAHVRLGSRVMETRLILAK